MSDPRSSKEKWESIAHLDKAETDHARALQQGISIGELRARDELERQSMLPEALEPEDQAAITAAVEKGLFAGEGEMTPLACLGGRN